LSKSLKSFLKNAFFFLLAAVLVWLALRNISPADRDAAIESVKKINPIKTLGILAIIILSHVFRAYRWNNLLEPLGYKITFKNAFFSVMAGYLVNYAIPRAGELTRCTIINKYERVPFQTALGTVVLERIIDFILLVLFFLVAFFTQLEKIKDLADKYIFQKLQAKFEMFSQNPLLIVVLAAILLVVIVGTWFFRTKIQDLFKTKLGGIIKGFLDGLSSIKKVKNPIQFIVLSISIWLCYFFGMYFSIYLFEDIHVGMSEMLVTYILGTVGIILTPGGLGAYQLIVQETLVSFQVQAAAAFAFAWVNWLLQFFLVVLVGGLSFLLLPLTNKESKDVS
jgi:glycosyltransferase 2 family protein